jgi:phospholipase C
MQDDFPMTRLRKALVAVAVAALILSAGPRQVSSEPSSGDTATPIKHVVVIFQENVSFDHYFATYPQALNSAGEPAFHPRQSLLSPTPSVNGLTGALLTNNPNGTNPFRLSRSQNYTCDQDHDYGDEQKAFHGGLMDRFPSSVGVGSTGDCNDYGHGTNLVMGYYDGNTVTGLWNYAQHFAMNDNSFNTTFGPSTPGHLNLIAGETAPYDSAHTNGDLSGDVAGDSVIGDPDPYYDDCGAPAQLGMTGKNVGDLLNAAGITWGWFEGGFTPTTPYNPNTGALAVCGAKTARLDGTLENDYSAHHQPFQYYPQTANPHHLPPSAVAAIGHSDQANHQYDLTDFWNAAQSGNLPAVSFLKPKRGQDGHAGYSSPLDEQVFLVNTINALQQLPEWPSIAIFISYDDSDGWYDHVMSPIVNQSNTPEDELTGEGSCGTASAGAFQGRCGYGPRLPLLLVSRWARVNFVDHTLTDQSSILRFIEDNWQLGRLGNQSYDALAGSVMNLFDFGRGLHARRLILDPATGEPQ